MPLHEDCTPGHVLTFAVIGRYAHDLEEKAKLMAEDYFDGKEFELTLANVSSCTYVDEYNVVVHGYGGFVTCGIAYQDKDTKAQKESRGNPFGMLMPMSRMPNGDEDGDPATHSGGYV